MPPAARNAAELTNSWVRACSPVTSLASSGGAIGDAEVMVMGRDVDMRVRVAVRDALMSAVVVIHDMIMRVRCPVEMLVRAALPVIAGVVVLPGVVVGMGHMRDALSGRGSEDRASRGAGLNGDVIVRLFMVAIYIKGLIHPVASGALARRWTE